MSYDKEARKKELALWTHFLVQPVQHWVNVFSSFGLYTTNFTIVWVSSVQQNWSSANEGFMEISLALTMNIEY